MNKSEFIQWLVSQIDFNSKYHNHKETMAWVITALYLPTIISLGYFEGQILRDLKIECVVLGIIFITGILLVLPFVFIQFHNRWEAADRIEVLIKCIADLNREGEVPRTDQWIIRDNKNMPDFIQCEVDKLMKKRKNLKKFISDTRGRTELLSYAAIGLATVVAMCLAWSLPLLP